MTKAKKSRDPKLARLKADVAMKEAQIHARVVEPRRRFTRRLNETLADAKARAADPIGAFIRECVERVPMPTNATTPRAVVSVAAMYQAYRQWREVDGERPCSRKAFVKALASKGIWTRGEGRTLCYLDARVRTGPAADAMKCANDRLAAAEERAKQLTECLDGLAQYAEMSAEHLTLASELAKASRSPEHAIRFAKWSGNLFTEVSHARLLIRGHQATPDLASMPGARLVRAAEPPRPATVADEEIPF
ncbi:hypothetical protein RA307_09945 [Xanthobacteraceae bacterium Astr-EGSB]|uniref:hypothetical protein n=1 Tax=Astrobacterium formosum TaxID=3069710 RepID=UPI0027B82A87|nr:hypothetical protein [Xanthobacteraceae bacterium Astr-EGSB]